MASAWADSPFDGFGLPEPPPPLADSLGPLKEGTWGTRPGTPALRGVGWFLEEADADEAVDDYLLTAVEDVATGVPAVHFVAVIGPLWLLVQARLVPGPEGAPARPDDAGRAALWGATELVMRAPDELVRLGSGRLVVTDTIFSRSEWHWTGRPPADGFPGVAGALGWIDGLG